MSLQNIFAAIGAEEFERAAHLRQQRFESKGLFWLYAARVGATAIHLPYAERVSAAHSQILKITEYAVSLSINGDPRASVKHLLVHGTPN